MTPRRALGLAAVALSTLVLLPGSAAADAADLLRAAARRAARTPYTGEALWASWEGGRARVVRSRVAHRVRDRMTIRFAPPDSDEGSPVEGTPVTLALAPPGDDMARLPDLERKYEVRVTGSEQVLDRPCTRVQIRRRADGRLRERVWIDDESGLTLRRQSYDGAGRLLRLATWVSLDLRPRWARSGGSGGGTGEREAAVDESGLAVLRSAGWHVPGRLPGGYRPLGAYAASSPDASPLQVVYGDGLYRVSLFQQPGAADMDALPPGGRPSTQPGFRAIVWPGAVPTRLVWQGDDVTYALVGDIPPDELWAIARSLPGPPRDSLVDRLGRGLRALWSWLSPW
ncbi:MAG: hypothetical protein KY434_04150 [Actinobacteria bacterium]|nr:hypothetical protein [Actinomycetota bacterium]